MKAVRTSVLTLILTTATYFVCIASASAFSLSTPSGMKTISNTPTLSWTTADNELADVVRVSKSPAVADGQLSTRYTSLGDDELTAEGVNAGSTAEWADSAAAPLWPGTYYWQVHYITTNADGSTTGTWSEVRKVVVPKYFADDMKQDDGLFVPHGDTATESDIMKIHSNAKSVPARITYKLNGHVYATLTKPFTRISDIGQQIATSVLKMKLKASYYVRGTNVITVSGYIGSKGSTGTVERFNHTDRFKVK